MGNTKSTKVTAKGSADVEPKCGDKTTWGIAAAVSGVLGLIFLIVAVAMGGCDCSGCIYEATDCNYLTATSWFNGCDFDLSKCSAAVASAGSAKGACSSGDCDFGGLPTAAFFALLIFGIIGIICGIVFSCGVCACCCFAPDDAAAGAAPAAAAPVAAPVAAPAAPVDA